MVGAGSGALFVFDILIIIINKLTKLMASIGPAMVGFILLYSGQLSRIQMLNRHYYCRNVPHYLALLLRRAAEPESRWTGAVRPNSLELPP